MSDYQTTSTFILLLSWRTQLTSLTHAALRRTLSTVRLPPGDWTNKVHYKLRTTLPLDWTTTSDSRQTLPLDWTATSTLWLPRPSTSTSPPLTTNLGQQRQPRPLASSPTPPYPIEIGFCPLRHTVSILGFVHYAAPRRFWV